MGETQRPRSSHEIFLAVAHWSLLFLGAVFAFWGLGLFILGAVPTVSLAEYARSTPPLTWDWETTTIVLGTLIMLKGASKWRAGRWNLGQLSGVAWLVLLCLGWGYLSIGLSLFPTEQPVGCARTNC